MLSKHPTTMKLFSDWGDRLLFPMAGWKSAELKTPAEREGGDREAGQPYSASLTAASEHRYISYGPPGWKE